MNDKTPKYSTVIDFLFPFDMSYFFTSKKMETSIKVIILGLIIYGLYLASIEISQFLLKDEKEATLDDAGTLIKGIMFGLCILYIVLAHTVFGVLSESIILTIEQWKSSKHKPQELAPKPEAVNQDSPIEEIQEKEEPVKVEVVADVQEKQIEVVSKANPSIIDLTDSSKLEAYIKENENIYAKGDGAALLYDILLEKEVTEANLKDFHEWLKSLIDVITYTGLSEARKRIETKKSEGDEDIMKKRDDLLNQITNYIV